MFLNICMAQPKRGIIIFPFAKLFLSKTKLRIKKNSNFQLFFYEESIVSIIQRYSSRICSLICLYKKMPI